MNQRFHAIAGFGLVLALTLAAPAWAGPAEFAHAAASKASQVATKVGSAVKHGVQKSASAVEHGASVAGHAVSKTATKLGLPTASAASSPTSSSP